MLYEDNIQKELERVLPLQDFLDLYVMRTLLLSIQPTEEHLTKKASFGHDCIMKMTEIYWKSDQALHKSILALERCLALGDWELQCSFKGVGGIQEPQPLEWHFSQAEEKAKKILALYEQGKTYKDLP